VKSPDGRHFNPTDTLSPHPESHDGKQVSSLTDTKQTPIWRRHKDESHDGRATVDTSPPPRIPGL